jgi:hypothetical protein
MVLALIMATLFAGLAVGYGAMDTFRQNLRATQILTEKTESVRLCRFDDQLLPLNNMSFQESYTYNNETSTNKLVYYGKITVASSSSVIPNNPSYQDKIKLVTISLVWTNNVGSRKVPHSRQMQTLVSYYGLVNYIYGSGFTQQ